MRDCLLTNDHYDPPRTFMVDGVTITVPGAWHGICPMKLECPKGECGYRRTRRIIAQQEAAQIAD